MSECKRASRLRGVYSAPLRDDRGLSTREHFGSWSCSRHDRAGVDHHFPDLNSLQGRTYQAYAFVGDAAGVV